MRTLRMKIMTHLMVLLLFSRFTFTTAGALNAWPSMVPEISLPLEAEMFTGWVGSLRMEAQPENSVTAASADRVVNFFIRIFHVKRVFLVLNHASRVSVTNEVK